MINNWYWNGTSKANHSSWNFSMTSCSVALTSLTSDSACTISFASAWRLRVNPSKYFKHAVVITSELMKSVVVIAKRSVLASVTESVLQHLVPSADIVSMQATTEECNIWNLSKASILSIHLVRQRSLSFRTCDSGCVFDCLFKLLLTFRMGREKDGNSIDYVANTYFLKWGQI